MKYLKRHIDKDLLEWKNLSDHKPLLIRGARQVGKSTAIREFGKKFKYFIELNLEKQPSYKGFFTKDIDVKATCAKLSASFSTPIIPGETLLFIDEIQSCEEAIASLRYFREDYPELHVIAAGSLLEFALEEISTFAVGRIRSLYLYPFSFDEFLWATGKEMLCEFKTTEAPHEHLPEPMHQQLIELLRTFFLVGGMPAAVREWTRTSDYLSCAKIHNDILDTYNDDFSKYNKHISPNLLRQTLRSVALQIGNKFVCAQVDKNIHSAIIKEALHLLSMARLIIPVTHTDGNGLPLGAEENVAYTKYLFADTGLLNTLLASDATDILLSSEIDFVNKGGISEMFAGLELAKYHNNIIKSELHYWQNPDKKANAEVDYLIAHKGKVMPIEVKANTKGSMQSLWVFMRKKHLKEAVRTSLENFGEYSYCDKQDNDAERHVNIIPLYAISSLSKL